MNNLKDVYERKFNNEWKCDQEEVGRYSLGWLYLKEYLLSRERNVKILDVGCGNGNYSFSLLKNHFTNVYAIDLFDEVPFTYSGFHYQKASFDNLPFDSEFFDFLFVQSVIYYSTDYEKTIIELKRVLKPGGIIYISGHTKYSIYTLIRRLKLKLHLSSVEHLENVKFHSVGFYRKLLVKYKFHILKTDGWGMFLLDNVFALFGIASRVLCFNYQDPRKVICKNDSWCKFKSIVGYHFVILAKKDK